MAILTFPDLGVPVPSNFELKLVYNTQTFVSPLNKTTQSMELPGALWSANILYDMLDMDDASLLEAWIMSLHGRAGRFYLWDLMRPYPRGVPPDENAAPVVIAASSAVQITGVGFRPAALILKAGDKVGIGGELKSVTATVISDSAGGVTIKFAPPLRRPLATYTGADIVIVRPTAVMMLQSDDQGGIPWTNGNFPMMPISCIEALT